MSTVRIALANIRMPATPEESVVLATGAIAQAAQKDALVICFPECFIPGYRWPGTTTPPPDPVFLEQAWVEVSDAATAAGITVILGTERLSDRGLQITTCVFRREHPTPASTGIQRAQTGHSSQILDTVQATLKDSDMPEPISQHRLLEPLI